ncbi:hypothetical protein BDZ45DRAFT_655029 [Acephala macrosclerotiorum]|nr:hypothetical protein BDZ45DRAFT_655029 [Acephala macrosclerotiorum]
MSQSNPAREPRNSANDDDQARGESSVQRSKLVRSYIACRRCHGQKVKCSGETPCRNCKGSKRPVECIYPVRDKKIAVSEKYLRTLESQNRSLKRGAPVATQEPVAHHQSLATPETAHDMRARKRTMINAPAPIEDNGTSLGDQNSAVDSLSTELDETSIQPTYVGEAACTTFGGRLRQFLIGEDTPALPRRPKYYKHARMLRTTCTDCSLPNRSDAHLLVRVVLRFVGPDYHLIRKKSFLERLDETYRLNVLDDPIWLCRLFTVFALGEIYTVRSSKPKGTTVPGTAFFLKALDYFQDLYEEPTIEYIETLVLLSFYSTTLNRRNTAYTYIGLALRLSIVLGLHRKVPANSSLTSSEREHRVRVWWTVYCLDRIMSSKVGLPAMIQDADIDTPLPSRDGLSQQDMEDFYDPAYLMAQVALARITGNVLGNIYHIPQPDQSNNFVHGVQTILTSLRNFHEALPPLLRLDQNGYLNRSVASLHLHFNQCVILTTRPILFYVFRQTFARDTQHNSDDARAVSQMTTALADACVQTARKSNKILSQLWVDGCLAVYGFYDALSIFSSTLVLMISAAMEDPETPDSVDDDGIGVAWSLLRSMRDDGNVPASDYYEQLVQLEEDLKQACARRKRKGAEPPPHIDAQASGLDLLLAASGTDSSAHGSQNLALSSLSGNVSMTSSQHEEYLSSNDPLNDPFLSGFLSQPQASWPFDIMFTSGSGDQSSSWGFD